MSDKIGIIESTDIDGNIVKSSKRLWGSVFMSIGGIILTVIGVMSIFFTVKDPETALQVCTIFITAGCALLGIGVLDNLGESIGRKIGGAN